MHRADAVCKQGIHNDMILFRVEFQASNVQLIAPGKNQNQTQAQRAAFLLDMYGILVCPLQEETQLPVTQRLCWTCIEVHTTALATICEERQYLAGLQRLMAGSSQTEFQVTAQLTGTAKDWLAKDCKGSHAASKQPARHPRTHGNAPTHLRLQRVQENHPTHTLSAGRCGQAACVGCVGSLAIGTPGFR